MNFPQVFLSSYLLLNILILLILINFLNFFLNFFEIFLAYTKGPIFYILHLDVHFDALVQLRLSNLLSAVQFRILDSQSRKGIALLITLAQSCKYKLAEKTTAIFLLTIFGFRLLLFTYHRNLCIYIYIHLCIYVTAYTLMKVVARVAPHAFWLAALWSESIVEQLFEY